MTEKKIDKSLETEIETWGTDWSHVGY
jgi:hypothetical protein